MASGIEVMERCQGVYCGRFHKLIQVDPLVNLMRDVARSRTHGDNRNVPQRPQVSSVGGARNAGVDRFAARKASGGPVGGLHNGVIAVGQRTTSVCEKLHINTEILGPFYVQPTIMDTVMFASGIFHIRSQAFQRIPYLRVGLTWEGTNIDQNPGASRYDVELGCAVNGGLDDRRRETGPT